MRGRWLLLLVLVIFSIGCIGCGNNGNEHKASEKQKETMDDGKLWVQVEEAIKLDNALAVVPRNMERYDHFLIKGHESSITLKVIEEAKSHFSDIQKIDQQIKDWQDVETYKYRTELWKKVYAHTSNSCSLAETVCTTYVKLLKEGRDTGVVNQEAVRKLHTMAKASEEEAKLSRKWCDYMERFEHFDSTQIINLLEKNKK